MKKLNLTQNINGADAPGHGLSSAPWNIFSNTSFNSKEVQNAENAQSGRSMIEMLGVLAIIGVLSVGGIAGYSKAMQKYRINKTIEQITLIAGNVRAFFAPQRNYYGLFDSEDGMKLIKKAKLVPEEMLTITDNKITAITNAFGGTFRVYVSERGNGPLNDDGSDYNAFEITIADIPEEACVELGVLDWGSVSGSGLISVSVGGDYASLSYEGCSGEVSDDYTLACPNGSTVSVPMPIDKATDACNCGDSCIFDIHYY